MVWTNCKRMKIMKWSSLRLFVSINQIITEINCIKTLKTMVKHAKIFIRHLLFEKFSFQRSFFLTVHDAAIRHLQNSVANFFKSCSTWKSTLAQLVAKSFCVCVCVSLFVSFFPCIKLSKHFRFKKLFNLITFPFDEWIKYGKSAGTVSRECGWWNKKTGGELLWCSAEV